MIQEAENGNWTSDGYMGGLMFATGSPPAQLSANFTKLVSDDWNGNCFRDYTPLETHPDNGQAGFRDCEFYNFEVSAFEMASLSFTNCLFFRVNQSLWGEPGLFSPNLTYENCTFYNGGMYLGRYAPANWWFENCSIDGTEFSWSDIYSGTNYTTIDYNSYNTSNLNWRDYSYYLPLTNGVLETNGPNTLWVTNYDWETSWFGSFYLPTNSPLIRNGSTNANLLGLYWFTTQTNQSIEGANRVTIGYSYVATDTNGNPLANYDPKVPNYILFPDGPPTNWLVIVTNPPPSLTVTQGSNAIISVVAAGAPLPLSYQWFWNGWPLSDGGNVSGSESSTLNLSAVQLNQAGGYYVVVTNSFGSVTSTPAVLLVSPSKIYDLFPPYILPPYAFWNVTDISDPAQPVNIGELQAPFSESSYSSREYGIPPLNTLWHSGAGATITNAYATTEFGGVSNLGTVFQISLIGAGISNLHSFNGLDGAYPCSQLAISGSTSYGISNVVYGTTAGGGSNGYGTVFKLNADGSSFADLYQFTGTNDGRFPQAGLLMDGNTLYGTTSNSVFKINADGSDFSCLTNVVGASQLILSLSGETLYGTTYSGGTSNEGALFSIDTGGGGLNDIYNFSGGTNGAFPVSGLELYGIGSFFWNGPTNLALFGTTSRGGAHGYGMVFSINTDGSGFTDLHDFNSNSDGAYPIGGLLITNNNVIGHSSPPSFGQTRLFGTTSIGGTNGGGTVFGMNLDGSGFATLYSFSGTPDSANPEGKLVANNGILYGTTSEGGAASSGTVFSLSAGGTNFNYLFGFSGDTNGGAPRAGLALPAVNNLESIWSLETTINVSSNYLANLTYSEAMDNYDVFYMNGSFVSWTNNPGGAYWSSNSTLAPYIHEGENNLRVVIGGDGDGADYFVMAAKSALTNAVSTNLFGATLGDTVYEIARDGTEATLFTFPTANGSYPDGLYPIGDLILSSNLLYGVTQFGGANSDGTIFSLTVGSTNNVVLHSFGQGPNDGVQPVAGLILSGNILYGTTEYGGTNIGGGYNEGTVFRVDTDGSNYQTLYSFDDPNNIGGQGPEAPLLLIGTNLYGTSWSGVNGQYGFMFSVCTNGSNYRTILGFGTNGDGWNPIGKLAVSGNTLYGVTQNGGIDTNGNSAYGTIFSFTIGSTTDSVLYAFTQIPDAENPEAGLVLSGNTLYGTTYWGGSNNYGTVFRIGTNGNGYANFLSFGSYDSGYGENPDADLIVRGDLIYGTTFQGGANGHGMAFSISTNGAIFNDIHDFSGGPDGANPEGGLCSP